MYCAVVGMSKYIFRETPTRRAGRKGVGIWSSIVGDHWVYAGCVGYRCLRVWYVRSKALISVSFLPYLRRRRGYRISGGSNLAGRLASEDSAAVSVGEVVPYSSLLKLLLARS